MAGRSMIGKRVKASWWLRSAPRDRRALMALGGVFLLVFAAAIVFLRVQRINAQKTEIAAYQRALGMVFTQGAAYKDAQLAKQNREATISSTPLSFASLIEQAENTAGVQATDQEEKAPTDDAEAGLRTRSISFEMRDINVEQMTKFLTAIESKQGHVVLAEHLEIRPLRADTTIPEDRLKVDYELTTWERTAPVTSEE